MARAPWLWCGARSRPSDALWGQGWGDGHFCNCECDHQLDDSGWGLVYTDEELTCGFGSKWGWGLGGGSDSGGSRGLSQCTGLRRQPTGCTRAKCEMGVRVTGLWPQTLVAGCHHHVWTSGSLAWASARPALSSEPPLLGFLVQPCPPRLPPPPGPVVTNAFLHKTLHANHLEPEMPTAVAVGLEGLGLGGWGKRWRWGASPGRPGEEGHDHREGAGRVAGLRACGRPAGRRPKPASGTLSLCLS